MTDHRSQQDSPWAPAAARTLAPAVLTLGARVGVFEPRRAARTRGWRRIGTGIVRWPGPVLVVACALAMIGLLALPGYKTSYDSSPYMPASVASNVGYAAADRHFSRARLEPELLMIETDHDMRNPADMLILDRVAKGGVREIIVATNPSMEGDATALYLQQQMRPYGVHVTRLARGLPVGGDLEYADQSTLLRALSGRQEMD